MFGGESDAEADPEPATPGVSERDMNVLKAPRQHNATAAIIFGEWKVNTLGPEVARAFLRHAYNIFYHDFANVDIKKTRFIWQVTYREALLSFRNALLRYAVKLRQLHATRKYTSQTDQAPEEAYNRYPEVIKIRQPEGNHALHSSFPTGDRQSD